MKVGDLVQSKRYKTLGLVVEEFSHLCVTILWLDKNTETIEPKSGVIKLHKNT